MRALLAVAMVLTSALTFVAAAEAKPEPAPSPRLTPAPSDLAIAVGAAGAMMESDYFKAPNARFSGHGALACRLQSEMFSKIRVAQACN
jgi:hypothetical protein